MFKDYCDLCGKEIILENDMLKLEISRRGSQTPACAAVEMCPECKEKVLDAISSIRDSQVSEVCIYVLRRIFLEGR